MLTFLDALSFSDVWMSVGFNFKVRNALQQRKTVILYFIFLHMGAAAFPFVS